MPKMKTNKAVAKRIKVTARGKLMRSRPMRGHLKSRKTASRLRRMRENRQLVGRFAKNARAMLGI